MHKLAALVVLLLPGTASAGIEKKLVKHFADEFSCAKEDVVATLVEGSKKRRDGWVRVEYEVAGCGQKAHVNATTANTFYDDLAVRRRAPTELSCTDGELVYDRVDDKTLIVRGCERSITYLYSGTLTPYEVPGTWVANTKSE